MSEITGPSLASAYPGGPLSASAFFRLRVAVTLFFGLGGVLFAGWAVRIPAIKEQTGASPGPLGLALLCMTGSAVVTMLVAGRLCERFGSRQVVISAAALNAVAVVPPTFTHSALTLGLTLIIFGIAFGAIDVAVNSVAVDLIATSHRPIMPGFHAANSFGSLAGAGLGGALAVHLSPTQHMLLMAPIGLLATGVGARLLLTHPLPRTGVHGDNGQAEPKAGGRATSRVGLSVIVFGMIGLCAAYSQGAYDNWVPLHITEDLAGGQGIAAAGYAAVQLTLGLMRLAGSALLERFGPTRVVVTGGLAASAGALTAALAPSLWLVFAGLIVTGIGLANIFPVAMAQAGAAGGPRGVAVAATLGYCGILLAPPTIGFLADAFGLPIALNMVTLQVALAAVIAYAIRHKHRSEEPAPSAGSSTHVP